MEIKIKYHNGMEQWPLEKFDKGDCVDLRAAEEVTLQNGEYKLISLGVSMELPAGYHAQLMARSSTYKNFHIIMVNAIGIIDNSYCGDNDIWRFPALCTGKGEFGTTIHKGDRIAQFRIVKNSMDDVQFNAVDTLGNADRGGVGSTGVQ